MYKATWSEYDCSMSGSEVVVLDIASRQSYVHIINSDDRIGTDEKYTLLGVNGPYFWVYIPSSRTNEQPYTTILPASKLKFR